MIGLLTDWEIITPQPYGLFHICFLVLMIALCVVFVFIGKKYHEQVHINRIVLCFGIFLALIEIYKQVFYTLNNDSYPWYIFPFQFCSVPIYVCLINPFIRNKKIQSAGYYFLSYYGLLAGLMVMLIPTTVFNKYLTICLHTMLWHMSMVIVGCYLISARTQGRSFNEVKSAFWVWLGFVGIALVADIIGYQAYFKNHSGTWNLFYISPYYDCVLPILGDIYKNTNWLIFFICYIIAFTGGVVVVYYICKLINKGIKRHNSI